MARPKCKATKRDGTLCQSFAVSDAGWCISHDPDRQDANREASRRGGENRSAYRRAARQWAAVGREIDPADLPAVLRAAIAAVWEGTLEPSQASAIATLARVSVQLTTELELEERLARLEAAAGIGQTPANVRRIA
jgi:hypothetical protein